MELCGAEAECDGNAQQSPRQRAAVRLGCVGAALGLRWSCFGAGLVPPP